MHGAVWLLVVATAAVVHAYTCPPCVGPSCSPSSWINRGAQNVTGGAVALDASTVRHKSYGFKNDAFAFVGGDAFGGNDYVWTGGLTDGMRTNMDAFQTYIRFPSVITQDEFIIDVGDNTVGWYIGLRAPSSIRYRAGRGDVTYANIATTADALGCEGNIAQFLDGLAHEMVWYVDSGAVDANNFVTRGSRIALTIDNTLVCSSSKSTTMTRDAGNVPRFASAAGGNIVSLAGASGASATPTGESTTQFTGRVDTIRSWDGVENSAVGAQVVTDIQDAYGTSALAMNAGRIRVSTQLWGQLSTLPLAVSNGDIAVDFWFRTSAAGFIPTGTDAARSAVHVLSVRWLMDLPTQWHFRATEILVSLRPSNPGGIDLMHSPNIFATTTSFTGASRLARMSTLPYNDAQWHRYTLQFHRGGTRVAFWFDGRVRADVLLPVPITGTAQPVVSFNIAAGGGGNEVAPGLGTTIIPAYVTGAYVTQNFHSCGAHTVVNTDYCINSSWPICSVDSCSTTLLPAAFTRNCSLVSNAECRADTCSCVEGYTGNGFSSCTDINECAAGSHDCHANATCSNVPGGHECTCNTGFQGFGRHCVDDNECFLPDHPETRRICTSPNYKCVNTVGSFFCECNTGFTGANCTDINECEQDTDNCGDNTVCTNTAGSFTCVCDDGFSRVSVDECSSAFRQHQRAIGSFFFVVSLALLQLLV